MVVEKYCDKQNSDLPDKCPGGLIEGHSHKFVCAKCGTEGWGLQWIVIDSDRYKYDLPDDWMMRLTPNEEFLCPECSKKVME